MKKLQKSVSIALLATIIGSNGTEILATSFKDMPNTWSKEALSRTVEDELIHGTNGYINPKAKLTRAELATILNRLCNNMDHGDISHYADVKESDWFYKEMSKIVETGLIRGSGNSLNPTKNISREEVFVVMGRLLGLDEIKGDLGFKDENEISVWSKSYIKALIEAGYISGYEDNTIRPKENISREEFAYLLSNAYGTLVKGDVNGGTIEGNLIVNNPNHKIRDCHIKGNLIVAEGLGKGRLELDNCRIDGKLILRSSGKISINKMNVDKLKIKDKETVTIDLNYNSTIKDIAAINYPKLLNLKDAKKTDESKLIKSDKTGSSKYENKDLIGDAVKGKKPGTTGGTSSPSRPNTLDNRDLERAYRLIPNEIYLDKFDRSKIEDYISKEIGNRKIEVYAEPYKSDQYEIFLYLDGREYTRSKIIRILPGLNLDRQAEKYIEKVNKHMKNPSINGIELLLLEYESMEINMKARISSSMIKLLEGKLADLKKDESHKENKFKADEFENKLKIAMDTRDLGLLKEVLREYEGLEIDVKLILDTDIYKSAKKLALELEGDLEDNRNMYELETLSKKIEAELLSLEFDSEEELDFKIREILNENTRDTKFHILDPVKIISELNNIFISFEITDGSISNFVELNILASNEEPSKNLLEVLDEIQAARTEMEVEEIDISGFKSIKEETMLINAKFRKILELVGEVELQIIRMENYRTLELVEIAKEEILNLNPNNKYREIFSERIKIVEDGIYQYQVETKLNYPGAKFKSKTYPILVDTKAPIVEAINFNPSSNTLDFKAYDEGSGLKEVWVEINGNSIEKSELENISKAIEKGEKDFNISLEEISGMEAGKIEITIGVKDQLDNQKTYEYEHLKENRGAYIYFLDPLPDSYNQKTEGTSCGHIDGYIANYKHLDKVIITIKNLVTGKTEKLEPNLKYIKYAEVLKPEVSKYALYTGEAYYFEDFYDFEDGAYDIRVEAVSKTGETNSIKRRLSVDSLAPTMDIEIEALDKNLKEAVFNISVEDNLKIDNYMLLRRDGHILKDLDTSSSSNIRDLVDLSYGTTIVYSITDAAGNRTTQTIEVDIDKGSFSLIAEKDICEVKNIRELALGTYIIGDKAFSKELIEKENKFALESLEAAKENKELILIKTDIESYETLDGIELDYIYIENKLPEIINLYDENGNTSAYSPY